MARGAASENQRIAAYAQWEEGGVDGRIMFLCECDDPFCHAYVRWTLAEFDAVRAQGGVVLAPGHRYHDDRHSAA
ncbi:MAG TPA: hypothetical protein VFA05_06215 [Gaiellaceae bacterium]|nr:hypothetical protein [Gaiellaceae bacterium]